MTAYSYQEKKDLFANREQQLRHAIKHGFPEEKLFAAAEKLRAARLGMFKCRFTLKIENYPYHFSAEAVSKRNKGVQKWLSMSAEEIVTCYATLSDENRHEGSKQKGDAQPG